MITQFLAWYLVVQLIGLLALPLAWRLLVFLPDRGYASARVLGILLASWGLWIAYSFGLLRNEAGSAWLAVLVLGAVSVAAGWPLLRQWQQGGKPPAHWRYVLAVEVVFLLAFAGWAFVRAHDPAANHTEKPMDLMFMNSILSSPTYPPMDAWLGGYPIPYYYFGYWMLTTLGLLSGQPPEIAYNLGQACWYGLLLSSAFGVGYNLLAAFGRRAWVGVAGGLLASLFVGMAANLQAILEWLYANGAPVGWVGNLLQSRNFPAEASVTHNWYIDMAWWWWRSSRVLADVDLAGNHIEVIDEFPAFSYILGDNHPHVLAMPFAILVISLALNLFLARRPSGGGAVGGEGRHAASVTYVGEPQGEGRHAASVTYIGEPPGEGRHAASVTYAGDRGMGWRSFVHVLPLGWAGWLVIAIAAGSLLAINTWDFPALWLLLVLAAFATFWRLAAEGQGGPWRALAGTAVAGGGLAVVAFLLYLPYFLTAQSQAGGIVPNLFNPTRLGQFVSMFAAALLALLALLLLAWRARPPRWGQVLTGLIFAWGLPLLFLLASVWAATNTDIGRELLARTPLPEGSPGYLAEIATRWSSQLWTFVLAGGLLGLFAALIWSHLEHHSALESRNSGDVPASEATSAGPLLFVLFLAAIGLLLVYAPEFVFLRDNFGTRMNTVFKFYYQAWLLFGLASAFAIPVALGGWRNRAGSVSDRPSPSLTVGALTEGSAGDRSSGTGGRGMTGVVAALLASLALLLGVTSTIFLFAGAYSKAAGFSTAPTFDATAWLANGGQDELAAAAWVRENTQPGDLIVEGKGASYRADLSRISTFTGRQTLLGWDGHETQWRGQEYADMAEGRAEALEAIYRGSTAARLQELIDRWGIDYIYVGPTERTQYGTSPAVEAQLRQVLDLVFESGDVRIYRARGS